MTSFAGQMLRRVVLLCCRHPRLTVGLGLVLGALGVFVTSTRLTFETSELHLLPPGQPYVTRYREYSNDFGELDEISIVVSGRTFTDRKTFAERLVHELRAGPIRFNHLAYRVAPEDFSGTALLYLPTPALRQLRDRMFDHQELIESFVAAPGLVTLLDGMNRQFAAAFASHFLDLGLQNDATPTDVGLVTAFVSQLRETIRHPAPYRSPWPAMLSLGEVDETAGYFVSDDKSLIFILADPVGGSGGFTNDRAAIDEIRGAIKRLRISVPGIDAGVTGGPALSNDAMRAAFDDSQIATVLAFAMTLGLLLLAFRRLRDPLVMLAVLALSLVWSLGLITILVGHLTVFSVMFISIVIGLGIDYGIYVLFRFDDEHAASRALVGALELTATRTGPGILLGALTAAATFYVLIATDFHGVQELGFIAGTALLAAFVAMLTVFPAMLVLLHRRRGVTARRETLRVRDGHATAVIDRLTRHHRIVLAGAGMLTVWALWSARLVEFDYNLLNLQARGTESATWERRIVDTQSRASFSGLASATSLAELRHKRAAFERLPSVAGVDSALVFLPDDQPAKLKIIADVNPLVASLRVAPTPPVNLQQLDATLDTLARRVKLATIEAGATGAPVELRSLRHEIEELRRTLHDENPEHARARLAEYQTNLVHEFRDTLAHLQRNVVPRAVTLADVPADLRRKFVSDQGRFLLQIHPRVDVWDREGGRQFVTELRSVDADVTGTPILSYESIHRMESAYRFGALAAFAVVALIAAVMIRRWRETALALTPLVLGTLWAIGLLPVFGVKLNLANVWGVPLIIGASAEYGLNVVMRVMEARTHGGAMFARSTMLAVLFNGLSTITGFGSLLIAHHRGMWSLGLLLTLGSVTSLIAALVVLPVLIRLTATASSPSRPPAP